ncbi:MAG: alpha-rhamnosidase [Candidatus Hydrogenedentota bacterium]
MRGTRFILLSSLFVTLLGCQHGGLPAGPDRLLVVELRCEDAIDPLGVDVPTPRLSWHAIPVTQYSRAKHQSAYRILVAETRDALRRGEGTLWDSGRTAMTESPQIEYGGKPLQPMQAVYWKVRVWDEKDRPSPWSKVGCWETGLLANANWKGQWIQRHSRLDESNEESFFEPLPGPLFRKAFSIDKPVEQARLYITGLGYYEILLNGERVEDRFIDPAWTDYRKRVFYSVYDVTDDLRAGANVAGARLGNGWFNPLPLRMWGKFNLREALLVGEPRILGQFVIDYTDGSREIIPTDTTWQYGDSMVVANSVYTGETQDASAEPPDWHKPDFDASTWPNARLADAPGGILMAQPLPPIRRVRTIEPVTVTEPSPGVYIADFGENITGVASLRTEGPAGTHVNLRYGELLNSDGSLNGLTSVMGQLKNKPVPDGSKRPSTAWQQDTFILNGDGEEEFTPKFTFHGFRYVEITGLPQPPERETLRAHVIHTDVESAGEFECSNDLFNQIQAITQRTFTNNLIGVQSDCPHREKFGYGGDIVASSEAFMLNYDMAAFYRKTVHDFEDAVRPNGGFTETAPFVGIADEGLGEGSGPVGWGTVHPLLLWQLRQYYGETSLIDEQYDHAKRWVELLAANAPEFILDNGIGDHESLVEKPRPLTGTAFLWYNAWILARLAETIGKNEDAIRFDTLAGSVRDAFNRRFLEPGTGKYFSGTQACQAFALYFNHVPDAEVPYALWQLVQDILVTHNGHLSTGIFGTKYMLDALTRYGRHDVATFVVNQRDFPGWGHMIENGATTLWEHWEYSDNTFSHNHPMFGSVSEWFIKHCAGMRPADDALGFNKIIIHPQMRGSGLTHAEARYNSVRGPVRSAWRLDGRNLTLEVTIPVDATAEVHMPVSLNTQVYEKSRRVEEARGVEIVSREDRWEVYKVGSGRYEFHVEGLRDLK